MANEYTEFFQVVIQKKGDKMKKILVFLMIISFCGSANALNSTQSITQGSRYYISDHDRGFSTEQVLIVLGVGVIAGLIIYNLVDTKCENGLACVKF